MITYTKYSFLHQPRPELEIPREFLSGKEAEGNNVLQIKKEGTSNHIYVQPNRSLICKTRHPERDNGDHGNWKPSTHTGAIFQNLPGSGWYVFGAELMHSKVANGVRDINYIHEILVCDGEYLIGTTQSERQKILQGLFPQRRSVGARGGIGYTVLDDHTWLVKEYTSGFLAVFDSINDPHDEGVVVKNRNGILRPCGRPGQNASWQWKCRRAKAHYGFGKHKAS